MIDPRICRNPVVIFRIKNKGGSYLYSEQECLNWIEVMLERAKKLWSEERGQYQSGPARREAAFGKPTGRRKLFWVDSE